jgi:hypothetical protein
MGDASGHSRLDISPLQIGGKQHQTASPDRKEMKWVRDRVLVGAHVSLSGLPACSGEGGLLLKDKSLHRLLPGCDLAGVPPSLSPDVESPWWMLNLRMCLLT